VPAKRAANKRQAIKKTAPVPNAVPRKKRKKKQPRGRPSKFNRRLAKEILARLSTGEPLTVICGDSHMPCDNTVRAWCDANPAFSEAYASARARGFDMIALDALRIADNTGEEAKDSIDTEYGSTPNKEWLMRSKLRVDTRFRLLACWDPKRYGTKVSTELSGPNGKPVELTQTTEVQLSPEQEQRIMEAAAIGAALTPPGCLQEDAVPVPADGTEDE
jgi:hypothetical protein